MALRGSPCARPSRQGGRPSGQAFCGNDASSCALPWRWGRTHFGTPTGWARPAWRAVTLVLGALGVVALYGVALWRAPEFAPDRVQPLVVFSCLMFCLSDMVSVLPSCLDNALLPFGFFGPAPGSVRFEACRGRAEPLAVPCLTAEELRQHPRLTRRVVAPLRFTDGDGKATEIEGRHVDRHAERLPVQRRRPAKAIGENLVEFLDPALQFGRFAFGLLCASLDLLSLPFFLLSDALPFGFGTLALCFPGTLRRGRPSAW